jgi:hypothetical protein
VFTYLFEMSRSIEWRSMRVNTNCVLKYGKSTQSIIESYFTEKIKIKPELQKYKFNFSQIKNH